MSDDEPTGPPSNAGWQPPPPPTPGPPTTGPPTTGPYGAGPPTGAPPYGTPDPAYGYGYGYGGYAPPQTEGTAIGALIAAIGSWVICFPIAAIVALVLASTAKRKIAESGGRLTGQGLVTASKWIAWINLGVSAIAILFFIFAIVFAGLSESDGDPEFQRLVLALN